MLRTGRGLASVLLRVDGQDILLSGSDARALANALFDACREVTP
ncbi:MAG: hypothetical protein AB1938_15730 [Myxococcota bacterium]